MSDKQVTVTIKTGCETMVPPLCQILRALCYRKCCTVHKGRIQTDVAAALGSIQIMVGLFNIGTGTGRTSLHPGDLADLRAAYWLGAVYLAAGIMSLFAGRSTFCWMMCFAVFVNVVGSIFAIVGTVLYAVDLGDASITSMCNENDDDNCMYVAFLAQRLLTGMDITLIVLAVLQLCVCISFAVLGTRALVSKKEQEVLPSLLRASEPPGQLYKCFYTLVLIFCGGFHRVPWTSLLVRMLPYSVGGDVEIYQPVMKEAIKTNAGS